MVEVWLPYGRTEVCVRVPTNNLLDIIEPIDRDSAKNPRVEIEKALRKPFKTDYLCDMAKPGKTVALVLSDSDTSTNQIMISAILSEIKSAGVRDEDVIVIIAHNPFNPRTTVEDQPLFGDELLSRIKVIKHDYLGGKYLRVGKTSRGTEIWLNEDFVRADLKIVAGIVEPHPFTGFTGGRTGIIPGVSGLKTIRNNLLFALDGKAARGSLKGNPIHEDMKEAAQLAQVDFSLSVVRNNGFEIVKAFSGDLDTTFNEASELAGIVYRASIKGFADIVFITPGGSSLDESLFKASGCLDIAVDVAKKGKPIVLVAECAQGHGNTEFREAFVKNKTLKDLKGRSQNGLSAGEVMAYRLMDILQQRNVFLVSALPEYTSAVFRIKSFWTANEAYRYAAKVSGKDDKVSFIPNGNLVVHS